MKVAVIGTGYVGLVAGACLADLGNDVICVDVDPVKITLLTAGEIPIYEPGLEEIVKRNAAQERLNFTTKTAEAVTNSEIIFIAVGTPEGTDGKADLKYVKQVAEDIGKAMASLIESAQGNENNTYKIIVNKSTVPVGTGDMVKEIIRFHYEGAFDVVSNPEFLREGTAVNDFMKPDRVVIGGASAKAKEIVGRLYEPLDAPVLFTNLKNAELIKYASNSYLATRISFINELANLCDEIGGDITEVAEGLGLDHRIGKHFLNAGCGYGGSCFPKDVAALSHTAQNAGVKMRVIDAAQEANKEQKRRVILKLKKELPELKGKKIAVLGLAFKPNTDDMREAPSLTVIKELLEAGAKVSAYDPVAIDEAKERLQQAEAIRKIEFANSALEAVKDADAMLLLTEWNQFKQMDLAKKKNAMKNPLIIDGRNALNKHEAERLGFIYRGMGR